MRSVKFQYSPSQVLKIRMFETPNRDANHESESFLDKDCKYRCGSTVIVMDMKQTGNDYGVRHQYYVFHEETSDLIWLMSETLETVE